MKPQRKLLFAWVAYSVLLIAAAGFARLGILSGPGALLLAFMPLVPGIFVVLAVRDFRSEERV